MNILLTSVGRRTYMIDYFKRALYGIGQVHACNSCFTIAMQSADKSVCSPMIYDSNYIEFIINYCLENNIKAIVSLFDIDLPILAKSREIFADNGICVVVSDCWITRVCNDKFYTYTYLSEKGIHVPKTFVSLNKAKEVVNDGGISFPLMIKPRWGMGSIGIYQADNFEELNILYNKVKKDILNSYLKYESKEDVENTVLIQEKLLGQEYGIDVFNDLSGELAVVVPKKKIAMRSGETDCAEIIENQNLTNLGEKLSGLLKHIGNLDVDCFELDGEFYVLEMNCRFGGQYPFSHLAGTDFPGAIVNWLRGEEVQAESLKYKVGTIGVKDMVPMQLRNFI
ncbi:ATP-grasp domain-containing protein [Desulfoluna spongiiphila]|uniref:ATP-grasp domain-containing protein n=1 Tax=Desulfoluna spongiiphila TaxID=419481 RepID=UPI00125550C5|nr:ATP-grasp domain-containing protein [Desulfoluna spongiiphila]VVS95289.1 atp-grasp fold [Desulfoluna spongiiphila]